MYNPDKTVELIKNIAKSKNIKISDMLRDCNLSKNALSSMSSRGSWLQSNNLAKIADYLDCSVDYLLGRTDEPKKSIDLKKIMKSEQEIATETAAWFDKLAKSDIIEDKPSDDISEDLVILNRNAKKLSPENRKKLLDIAKVMFKEEFND